MIRPERSLTTQLDYRLLTTSDFLRVGGAEMDWGFGYSKRQYSALACFRMGMSASAFFQSASRS